jgi:hypothetical protein
MTGASNVNLCIAVPSTSCRVTLIVALPPSAGGTRHLSTVFVDHEAVLHGYFVSNTAEGELSCICNRFAPSKVTDDPPETAVLNPLRRTAEMIAESNVKCAAFDPTKVSVVTTIAMDLPRFGGTAQESAVRDVQMVVRQL